MFYTAIYSTNMDTCFDHKPDQANNFVTLLCNNWFIEHFHFLAPSDQGFTM